MIKSWLIISLLVSYTTKAATGPFPSGKLIEHIPCKSDATQSYALYIPVKGNKEALPVIYMFDPHGDGTFPLKKYKPLADAYGFILVGSHNSKNGNDWPATENIWRHLTEDTKARLKINDKRIYTCGFSGGGKVACYVAMQHPEIKGVIAGGASLPMETPAHSFNFSFTAIAGEGDMNLTDLVNTNNGLDHTSARHRIILFDGIHEWAPPATMDLAFAGLQFDAMREGTIPKDNALINSYATNSKTRLNSWYKTHQLLKAGQECQLSIHLLDGLTSEASWFKQQAAALANNPQYQQQRQAQDALLATEQRTKEEYVQHFQPIDMQYWTATINDLKGRAAVKGPDKAMYQRLLAYLSLAFYSIGNRLINSADPRSQNFVDLYKLADPTNSEAWYFSAILHAREKNAQAAESDLLKAVQCGFLDKDRLTLQPEFKTINLSGITAAMHRGSSR